MKKYLFICGCPRSGTTALWRQMISLDSVIIGVERFILKANITFKLEKNHYEKKRFFNYKNGDTHFPNLKEGVPGKYYNSARERFDSATYVGDKIPVLFRHYDKLTKEFPEVKIIFIFRNIFDVAQSYKARLNNIADPWKKDVNDAINDWNTSLNNTLKKMQSHKNHFFLIEYEDFFFDVSRAKEISTKMFEFLELETSNDFIESLNREIRTSMKLEEKRGLILNTEEKRNIMHHADILVYKKILDIYNKQF